MDHTVKHGTLNKKKKNLMIGEWFGVGPFSKIQRMVPVVRGNSIILPFRSEVRWPENSFYINEFFREVILRMETFCGILRSFTYAKT